MSQTKKHPYDQWSPDARALDLVGDKWTLLIVRDLMAGPLRFVALQRTLPGISTEQLRMRLNQMVADELLTRTRYNEVPPRVDYELTEKGRDLGEILGALARWGWTWAWGDPRPFECVDVTALFRLAPATLAPPKSMRGTIELAVGDVFYTLTIRRGAVTVEQGRAEQADASILGGVEDWITMLRERRSHLDTLGDTALCSFVLDGLAGPVDNVASLERAA